MSRGPRTVLPLAVVAAVLVTACGHPVESARGEAVADVRSDAVPGATSGAGRGHAGRGHALDAALSTPRRDSVYPQVGDPGLDALHYGLDLTWDAEQERLTGHESLVFRAVHDAHRVRLDLGQPLAVGSVSLDGARARSEHTGNELVVRGHFVADRRYTLVLDYAGHPRPVAAPTDRSDIPALGFTIDPQHQTWTMQEPYGAFTWYAVDDQPADKALYDLTLHVASPWTGVAGGTITSDAVADGVRTTRFHLDEPVASYLTTVAFGDYTHTTSSGPHGLPVNYWIPTDHPAELTGPDTTPQALRFLERRLGPFPFASAGVLVVDSDSGMETQTLMTLGNTPYALSREVVVHELAHQWYGDRVTPEDWRDVWMNEGMAMFLQLMYEAREHRVPMHRYFSRYVEEERRARAEYGPPAAYDRTEFGESNIYFGPALMWETLRERIGDARFFRLVRGWPRHADDTSTDRTAYLAYVQHATGLDLHHFWHTWLLRRTSPRF